MAGPLGRPAVHALRVQGGERGGRGVVDQGSRRAVRRRDDLARGTVLQGAGLKRWLIIKTHH